MEIEFDLNLAVILKYRPRHWYT